HTSSYGDWSSDVCSSDLGRSLVVHVGVARDLDLLHVPEGTLVDLARARDLPRGEVTLLTAGSQAEAASALVRIAMDDHKLVRVRSEERRVGTGWCCGWVS